MHAKIPYPIKFKPLYQGVTFALKDTSGKLLDDKTFPLCTSFSYSVAHSTFAVCASILKGAGIQHGVLEVRNLKKRVLQRINIDEKEYHLWLERNR